MMLMTKSLKQIIHHILYLWWEKIDKNDFEMHDWEDFYLHCQAYTERTHTGITSKELKILTDIYSKTYADYKKQQEGGDDLCTTNRN